MTSFPIRGTRLMWIAIAVATIFGSQARAESVHPTDGETATLLLQEILRPVEEAARAHGAQLLALSVVDSSGSDRAVKALSEAVGNFFWDAGYEVQILSPRTEPDPGAWRLDLTVDAAAIDTPRHRGSFLGLGETQWLRRAVLSVHGRLSDPQSGRWYWQGAPSLQNEDWIPASAVEELSADRPAWASAIVPPLGAEGAAWWEKGVVGGLLLGVVTLYFSGAN